MADLFSQFKRVTPENRNLTADTLLAYEEAYMKLLKNYAAEIQAIEQMMEQLRKERESFYLQKLPQIKERMLQEEIDGAVLNEWLTELQENMERSFRISESLIQHYVTDNLAEFNRKLQIAMEQV